MVNGTEKVRLVFLKGVYVGEQSSDSSPTPCFLLSPSGFMRNMRCGYKTQAPYSLQDFRGSSSVFSNVPNNLTEKLTEICGHFSAKYMFFTGI